MEAVLKNKNRSVVYWLLCGAFLVALMVVVGGITRLTHSGLSIVTWKPVTGVVPPLNEVQWMQEFKAYQATPEYLQKNYHFTVGEFKSIFWWEYFHRLIGRIIGIVFIIPFFYFLLTKKLKERSLQIQLLKLFFLGLAQGIIGWLMVKSGLVDEPRVSHYRLAIHLVMAFVLFGYIVWIALKTLYPSVNNAEKKELNTGKAIDSILIVFFIQITYGAFLAGLQAGSYYGTFPKMGDEWMPEIIAELFNEKGIISLVNFGVSVQFIHRCIAMILVVAVVSLFVMIHKNRRASKAMKTCSMILLVVIGVQFVLGVLTLLYKVPLILAAAHQIMALVFLACLVLTKYASQYFLQEGYSS